MRYPLLNGLRATVLWTEQFPGLDRRPRPGDGRFEAMGNMTGDPWPLLSSRKKRGIAAELKNPQALAAADRLAWIDGSTLYYGGEATPMNDLSLTPEMLPKRITAMGPYLIILPDKKYFNTMNPADYGNIQRLWASAGNVTCSLCGADGAVFPEEHMFVCDDDPLEGETPPEEGDYWLNTAENPHALYRLTLGEWKTVPDLYVKIAAAGIGCGLNAGDGVKISGLRDQGENAGLKAQLEALNAVHIVHDLGDDFIVTEGVIDGSYTQTEGQVRADRRMPDVDFAIECGNRLWGCRCALQNGEAVNSVYACALGDFRNWEKTAGTAADSYAAAVGWDGPFTGAAAQQGRPCFFKSGCVYRVYGDRPGNFQLLRTECDGVKAGCGASLAGNNGLLYYVSERGVEAFDALPQPVGAPLGDERFQRAAAGLCGGKYYLSAQSMDGRWDLYVLDIERGTWHRQDDSAAIAFAALNGEMYMLLENGLLFSLNGTEGRKEPGDVTWYAETAPMGYERPDGKCPGRVLLRLRLGTNAECQALIQYDSDGRWIPQGTLRGEDRVMPYLLPVIPRRCDHWKMRIQGHGEAQLCGMAWELKRGKA